MFLRSSPKGQFATRAFCYTALAAFLLLAAAASSAQTKILIEAYPPTGAVGTFYQTTLSARGGTAPYIYAASGLPQGLTLNGTSGVISGTPVSYGTSSVNSTVTDANGNDAYLTFSIAISKSGSVSLLVSPGTANLLSNQTQQFAATVFNATNKNVTWSCTAGTITSGGLYTAPTVNNGTWTYRVTATSVDDPSKSAGTIVEISPNIPSLQITTTSLPGFMAGNQYSQSVNVAGGTSPYHWKVISGALPDGISLNTTSGSVSGVSSQTGPFPVTVQVKDSSYPKQSIVNQPYTIVGSSILLVTTPLLPQITANQNYDTAVSVTGGVAPYKWSVASGSLPSGIVLNSSTGVVSGTTTQTGGYNVGVQVTDSSSPQQKASQAYFVESLPGQSTAADFYVATNGNRS